MTTVEYLRPVPDGVRPISIGDDVAPVVELVGAHVRHLDWARRVAARRGLALEVTVCDVDGIEIDGAPADSDVEHFACRATARPSGRARHPREPEVRAGVTDPIPRAALLAPGGLLGELIDAVDDLLAQLHVHPAELAERPIR
ncbi:hypothetical protein [Gordonia malaquae]|uniref:hypothetical protein n=1 Tax=Gordonia malaquae TaxID=410332 RepID=UPI003016BB59